EDSNIATGLGAATTLVTDDAGAIGREVSGIKRVTPIVRLRAWAIADTGRFYAQVIGGGATFGDIYGWSYARGKFFGESDVANRSAVAVLGAVVRDRLFGENANPLGKTVAIRNKPFTVVGVTKTSDEEHIESIFVPYTALQEAIGITYLHGVTIEAAQAGDATRITADVTTLLRRRHSAHIEAASNAVAKLRQGGILGNQMPGGGVAAAGPPDDFTVKTQASEALTKGLYTSVAAFVLANMP